MGSENDAHNDTHNDLPQIDAYDRMKLDHAVEVIQSGLTPWEFDQERAQAATSCSILVK